MARVTARYKFDATIVFMAVPGEEQGLLGATYFAEQAKKTNVDIEGMFTNDIVGNSLGGNGVRDARTVRVFSEGVPSNETRRRPRRGAALAVKTIRNHASWRALSKKSESAIYRR